MDTAAPDRPSIVVILVTGLIPLAFLALGAFLAVRAWPAVVEGFAMRGWPVAPGRVVEARMAKIERSMTDARSKDFYTLQLAYEYEAGGKTHRGDRSGLLPDATQWQPAMDWVAAHPAGKALRVRHDPREPSRSILDPSIGAGTWAMAIGALPLLALGVVMAIGWVRGLRRG